MTHMQIKDVKYGKTERKSYAKYQEILQMQLLMIIIILLIQQKIISSILIIMTLVKQNMILTIIHMIMEL